MSPRVPFPRRFAAAAVAPFQQAASRRRRSLANAAGAACEAVTLLLGVHAAIELARESDGPWSGHVWPRIRRQDDPSILSDKQSRRRIIPFYPSNPGPLTIISVAFLLPNPFRLMAMSFFFSLSHFSNLNPTLG